MSPSKAAAKPARRQFRIPEGQPVRGRDIAMFRQVFGLTVPETQNILGLFHGAYYKTQENPELPLDNVTAALVLRYYAEFPDEIPRTPRTDLAAIKEAIELNEIPEVLLGRMPAHLENRKTKGGQDRVPERRIGILLGRQADAAHRWKDSDGSDGSAGRGQRARPAADRAVQCFLTACHKKKLDWWVNEVVLKEAEARGLEDVFRDGTWQVKENKKTAVKTKTSKKKKTKSAA